MAFIKKKITFDALTNKAKEIAMRRIENVADKKNRLRMMDTVVSAFCIDTVHLIINASILHKAVWIPVRSGPQEDLNLLLNITSDILAWLYTHDIYKDNIIQTLANAYGAVGPVDEFDPNLDESNLFKDQSVTIEGLTTLLQEDPWYIAVILLSASDIRAELIRNIEAMTAGDE